jgi:Na+/melibiose symporter-like transporter
MVAIYFLLGGNKVFYFCRAMVVCVGGFFAVTMVWGARMLRVVVVCILVMLRGHAHHCPMVMMGNSSERHQHKGGKHYRQYGKLTFQY